MIPSKCHFVLCVQRALVRWQSSARRHRIQPSLGQGHQGLVPPLLSRNNEMAVGVVNNVMKFHLRALTPP